MTDLELRRMGYRLMHPDVWGKPVGYHLFVVSKKNGKWAFSNHFKGANGKLHVYSRVVVTDEAGLKAAETDTKVLHVGRDSDFGFLSQKEVFETVL